MRGKRWPFGRLRRHSYSLIVADPPWRFKNYSAKGIVKGAAAQYPVMPVDKIAALPVKDLAARDCLLLMWACGCMLPQALKVVESWGFTFKSEMVWEKRTLFGRTRVGPGYRVRSMHEPIIVATIGNPKHRALPSHFEGLHRGHSFKPEAFYEIVRECCAPLLPAADLFHDPARKRQGFEGWGNPRKKQEPS